MKKIADELITRVIENKEKIVYINLDENNNYRGWITDFNLKLPDESVMSLDLSKDDDLFLLFVLASSWSKTGPWENAAYFVTYLKLNGLGNKDYWLNTENVKTEILIRKNSAVQVVQNCKGLQARRKVSFRSDLYSSIHILAKEWESIMGSLEESNNKSNYMIFVNYLSQIEGLGEGKNKMRIKIPLILRELRCQNYFENIPGELCCVPDKRVMLASLDLGIKLPTVNNTSSLLRASKIIYDNFGDLYDIPLFAYEDIQKLIKNQ